MSPRDENGNSLSIDSGCSSPSNGVKRYPTLSELPPYGESVFPAIWNLDPASSTLKKLYTALAALALVGLIYISSILLWMFPFVDRGWDERYGIESSGLTTLPVLIELGIQIPQSMVYNCFWITGIVFGAMVVADFLLGQGKSHTHPYPESWDVANTKCYHEMFLEPTRFGRLLRRPGSVLSNAPFLLGSLCVMSSVITALRTLNNCFFIADLGFGIMLFFLAVFSCLWHSANAEWTHYPDLWSMDSCILYLIVRNVCIGFLKVLVLYSGQSPLTCKIIANVVCAAIYAVVVLAIGRLQYKNYKKKWLHGSCPFSVRARLMGTSSINGMGHQDCYISTTALFAALPFFYVLVPLLIQIFILKACGSIAAGNLCAQTLVVGWTYRLWERFLFDGNAIMNYLLRQRPSALRTIATALFAPTAVLHFLCGLTLVAGYVHSRTLEEQFF